MESILFWEDMLLNGRYFILGSLGCLMEDIFFWQDRLLNGVYFILGR